MQHTETTMQHTDETNAPELNANVSTATDSSPRGPKDDASPPILSFPSR